jgi:hypothetical protein
LFTLAKKCKVMATKRYNPKGDIHKQKIFEIIRNNFTTNPQGIHPQDITKLMKTLNHVEISRQAVHSHLRTLTDETKIMTKKDDISQWIWSTLLYLVPDGHSLSTI